MFQDEQGPSSHGFYATGQLFIEDHYTLAVLVRAGIGSNHLDGNARRTPPPGPCLRCRRRRQIHRAVAVIIADLIRARDRDVLRSPLRARPLGARIQRAVGHHREQHALDVGAELPRTEHPVERLADAQPPPQRVEQPHATALHLQLADTVAIAAKRLATAVAVGEARDRRRQTTQRVDIQLVLAAEVSAAPPPW
jgi:hypothetical protein